LEPVKSFLDLAFFIAFFPQLVAGPIVRAMTFLPQVFEKRVWANVDVRGALTLFFIGFVKKTCVSETVAPIVDAYFGGPGRFDAYSAWIGILFYAVQIYCDFSGYSDIAIGVSRVIGFDLPENFNMPYAATSITDFWRRWHITLSTWLRDYLYIPLGGNRRGKLRTYVNLAITMLLGGLWHGANWTFVVWGLLHGVGLEAHKLWREWRPLPPTTNGRPHRATRVLSWAATYSFVCLGWIFFRAPDFATAAIVLRKVLGLTAGGASWFYLPLFIALPVFLAAHVIGARLQGRGAASWKAGRDFLVDPTRWTAAAAFRVDRPAIAGPYLVLRNAGFVSAAVLAGLLLTLFLFAPLHRSPFIYFQF